MLVKPKLKSVDLQITTAGDRWNEEAQAYDKIELVDVYAKVIE